MNPIADPRPSPLVEEALESLRFKDPRSTTLERLRLLRQADEEFRGLPQPLRLGRMLRRLCEKISLPVEAHDLLLGRTPEEVPDGAGEAFFRETLGILRGGLAPGMLDGGHETLDWGQLLRLGLPGLQEQARRECQRRVAESAPREKLEWLEGACLVYESHSIYVERYSQAARAKGLDEAAEVARNLVDFAPRTFREALQLLWFVGHVYCTLCSRNPTLTFGRVDQLLHPFYERDLAAGRLTREQAGDLIEDFYCKNNLILGRGEHQMSGGGGVTTGWERNPCYDAPQYIVLGGQRQPGSADCSELSELFVERMVPRFENPYVVIRWSAGQSARFRGLVCRKILANASMMVYNDGAVVPAMERAGFSPEEAREYTMHGCNWPDLPPAGASQGTFWHNLPKLLTEMVAETNAIGSFEEFLSRFRQFYARQAREGLEAIRSNFLRRCQDAPGPLRVDDCFLDGPVLSANSKLHGGVRNNTTVTTFGGFATLVDSLLAVEDLVFAQGKLSFRELRALLEADFVEAEPLRRLCLRAPKFGRNDAASDRMAVRLMELMHGALDEIAEDLAESKIKLFRCVETDMNHIRDGRKTSATPDGRHAGEPISENSSPSVGCCTDGLTSQLQSLAKLPFDKCHSGALNLRLQPAMFAGEAGERRFGNLLETYFAGGGLQVQVSMVDTGQLREAQQNPEAYRDLMVRITGYSAAFVDMSEAAQNEIIRREEMTV